uniref:tRNA pseudouridine synthase n=1 Tax=Chenopodium quinoa TaxID=63459 RepID=A0A803NCX3_CHEQI
MSSVDCGAIQGESTSSDNGDQPQRPPKVPRIEEEEQQEEEVESMKPPKPGLQRYLVAFEYIGTHFSGSQQQRDQRTAVGNAFQKFVGQPVSVFGSSRTDAGVHALSNVCHVDVERTSKRKPGEVKEGDIMVIDVRSVPSYFHARYKAQERTYYYRLLSGPESLSTFERDRAWHVPDELNLQTMQEACKVLVGHHDFSSFRAAGCQAKSPVRTLDELHVSESVSVPYFPSFTEREQCNFSVQDSLNNSGEELIESCQQFGIRRGHRCLVVKARSRSFLYHQVRLLVGVLKCVGTGQLTVTDVKCILNARSVTAASPMAPACGLYLGHVKYDFN